MSYSNCSTGGASLDQIQRSLEASSAFRNLDRATQRELAQAIAKISGALAQGGDAPRSGADAGAAAGASTVRMEFTTVTRPMIAENSVSLEAAESPTLAEIGLPEPQRQRRRFERLGVRNAAELERLQSSAGESGVTRIAGVSHEQIRDALTRAQPALNPAGPIARPPGSGAISCVEPLPAHGPSLQSCDGRPTAHPAGSAGLVPFITRAL